MIIYTMVISVDDNAARGIAAKKQITSMLAKLAEFALNDACSVELYEDERPLIRNGMWVG